MILNEQKSSTAISAKISTLDIELIKIYMQGAVYSFCKNNPNDWFSVRVLFGGENTNWSNTPMQKLYDYHCKVRSENAVKNAAADAGHLLKQMLTEDETRTFEMREGYKTREYRLISNKQGE